MMNKISLRVIVLFIVLALILLILFRSRIPFGKDNSSFASTPKEEITRIEFSGEGKRLSLEKNDNNWLINGKIEARKSGVLFILRVLKEIKIKSPVSSEMFEDEIVKKDVLPVKVRVFENNRLLKTFLVYKTGSNTYGNIMKMKGSSKPFIVYVPGFEVNIGSAFTLNELYWQSYTVFNLLPSEIAEVNFENISDTASSFSIFTSDHHFSLSGGSGKLTGWDSSQVVRYISYFARVPFESLALETDEAEKKVIVASQPIYRITVTTSEGKKTVLSLWSMVKGEGETKSTDTDRLFGRTDDRDELFILRYFDIDPLIKKRSYFFSH